MTKNILMAVMALALGAANAQTLQPLTQFASGGTDVGNTICYAVISANGLGSVQPVVTYVSATSDKAASVLQFYTAGTPAVCNVTNTTVTIPVNATNGFAQSDVVIIRHHLTDTYERRILDAFAYSTNLVVTVAPTAAVVPGDLIYKATTAGTIPVGNATKELNGAGIYAGQAGKPLLVEIDGTSACQLNAISATYPQAK